MGKQDVFSALKTDSTDPGAYKSGEYFLEHALKRLNRIILYDRLGVIDALNEWLNLRSDPLTLNAVILVKKLGLVELIPMVRIIRDEVEQGKSLQKYFLSIFDKALIHLENLKNESNE